MDTVSLSLGLSPHIQWEHAGEQSCTLMTWTHRKVVLMRGREPLLMHRLASSSAYAPLLPRLWQDRTNLASFQVHSAAELVRLICQTGLCTWERNSSVGCHYVKSPCWNTTQDKCLPLIKATFAMLVAQIGRLPFVGIHCISTLGTIESHSMVNVAIAADDFKS